MTDRRTCPVVGLVGGVGSGKSTLARRAAELFGVAVVDGDAAGHRALDDSDVKTRLRSRFGDAIFGPGGQVDRRALAERVFGPNPEHALAKSDLESITHPVIRRELIEQIAEACAAGRPAVLLDAAVLLEAGWHDVCDGIVFVEAPDSERRARVAAARGWSEADWRRREAAQLPLADKRRRADAVIDNGGTPDEAAAALVAAVERICGLRLREPVVFAASPR